MKVTALIAAGIFAVGATASASDDYSTVSDAIKNDPSLLQRYCSQPGKPCAHVKDAVEKASVHLTYPDIINSSDFEECYKEGGKCQKAKRSAEALASAVAEAYAAAEPEPHTKVVHLCHLVGQPCFKARDAAKLAALSRREATANPDPHTRVVHFCHLVGQPCLKVREPEPEAKPHPRIIRLCHLVGQPCLKKKRSALPAPEPEANPHRVVRFCHLVGQPCLKVRNAADAVSSALYRRAADPEPHTRVVHFCHLVGQPCLKARDASDADTGLIEILDQECNKDGQPCAKAKRAAEDLSLAALQALEQSGL
ncbi:hypothetical protein NA57DRAFT_76356 [Rhizodiscina lignyota]|uniref:Uncharacterized protein n=1 Tax=Rhizodiscina lignyota TaxID=1504668 RepID=A0A9P4IFM4_9PEZI|nr:hypothetical protein NA57DRAFT_76356 [Rhizodiscina lignyota]